MTRARAVLAGALASALLAGCSAAPAVSGAEPKVSSYADPAGPPRAAPPAPAGPERALVAAAGLDPCPRLPPREGPPAGGLPDVTLPCLGTGPAVRLAALAGRPTVLSVWAQWCAPCRDEAPVFQRLHQRAGTRVRVLGVDYADSPAAALRFAAELGLSYPSVTDQDGVLKAPLRLVGLPRTLFVDATGRVRHVLPAPVRDDAHLAALVRDHLGVAL